MRESLWQLIVSAASLLWDPAPVVAVQSFFGPAWDWFFGTLTLLGTVYAVAVVISASLWLGGRRLAYSLLAAILFATATNALLWTLVGVPRPDAPSITVREHVDVSSFPSGHTVISTVLWGSLAAFSRIPKIVPVLIVPAVMLSRLYLGAHYLGDVLGGALIGLLLVLVHLQLWTPVRSWLSRRPLWFFLGLGLCAPFAILLFIGPSPRGWELFAVTAAMGIGLPLEHRYVRYEPAKNASFHQQALKAIIGLGVMVLILLGPLLLTGGDWLVLDVSLLALAVLWGVLVAPALFAYMRPLGVPGGSKDRGRARVTEP